jgi:hypothetical protein
MDVPAGSSRLLSLGAEDKVHNLIGANPLNNPIPHVHSLATYIPFLGSSCKTTDDGGGENQNESRSKNDVIAR